MTRLIDLDAMTSAYCSEPLTTRLWRCYDTNAIQILDEVQRDPSQAEQLIKTRNISDGTSFRGTT